MNEFCSLCRLAVLGIMVVSCFDYVGVIRSVTIRVFLNFLIRYYNVFSAAFDGLVLISGRGVLYCDRSKGYSSLLCSGNCALVINFGLIYYNSLFSFGSGLAKVFLMGAYRAKDRYEFAKAIFASRYISLAFVRYGKGIIRNIYSTGVFVGVFYSWWCFARGHSPCFAAEPLANLIIDTAVADETAPIAAF